MKRAEPGTTPAADTAAAAAQGHPTDRQLAFGVASPPRSYWPARIAILAAIGLYLTLPDSLVAGPHWLIPALEAAVLLGVSAFTPHQTAQESRIRRTTVITLAAMVSTANMVSLALLVHLLVAGQAQSGEQLLFAAIGLWCTNVIIFAIWFFELDRGGPAARHLPEHTAPDFLFPQMSVPGCSAENWAPSFLDYLYVSFTNATAFSPTDTMPLSLTAKSLMGLQSIVSLLTVTLVAARAVNILH